MKKVWIRPWHVMYFTNILYKYYYYDNVTLILTIINWDETTTILGQILLMQNTNCGRTSSYIHITSLALSQLVMCIYCSGWQHIIYYI